MLRPDPLAPEQSEDLLFNVAVLVGGVGFGTLGFGYVTVCGSSTSPPVTVPLLSVQAVTLLVVQVPTPVLGVDKLPLMVVELPLVERFPFAPMSPSPLVIAGFPLTNAAVES